MSKARKLKRIAIIGGGPSGLFMYKRLIESNQEFEITIFEKKQKLGIGMPYGDKGANLEHITNVSENEIPTLVTSIEGWSKTLTPEYLNKFNIDPNHFNEYKVLPRLFFGEYLAAQFQLLIENAEDTDQTTYSNRNCSCFGFKPLNLCRRAGTYNQRHW